MRGDLDNCKSIPYKLNIEPWIEVISAVFVFERVDALFKSWIKHHPCLQCMIEWHKGGGFTGVNERKSVALGLYSPYL